jgi:hypothetical protein
VATILDSASSARALLIVILESPPLPDLLLDGKHLENEGSEDPRKDCVFLVEDLSDEH